MKSIVLSENLRRAASLAEKATGKSVSLSILSYLLIEGEKNRIRLTGTNLDIALTVSISGKVEERGAIAVPAKILSSLSQELHADKVVIETIEETKLSVKTEEFRADIQGLRPDEFPIIPKVRRDFSLTIEGMLLKNALEQVICAAGTSEVQPRYSAILLYYQNDEQNLKLAATDSHRLAEKTIPSGLFRTELAEDLKILIPLRTSQELLRILENNEGEAKLYVDQNQILIELPDIEFYSRLAEADFPDYSGIIPKTFGTSIQLSKKRFLESLRRAGLFASRIQDIRLKVNPKEKKLELATEDPAIGKYNTELELKGEGEAMTIAFNWKLLAEGVEKVSGEEVFIGLSGSTAPALIRSDDDATYFYILAPLRL